MATVALQQVSSAFARENAKRTLEKPVAVKYLAPSLSAEDLPKMAAVSTDGAIFVWGSKFERYHQEWKMLPKQCLILFRRGSRIFKVGVVAFKIKNEALAERLWGRDNDGKTWSLIYFLSKVHDVAIDAGAVNRALGYQSANHWQGLVVLDTDEAENVIEMVKEVVRSNKSSERT